VTQPLSRWHRLFADALANREAIGVAVTVEQHLGRQPTRSEMSAARRAAQSYAGTGRAHIKQVSVTTPIKGRAVGTFLVLVRPGSAGDGELDQVILRQAAQGWTSLPSSIGRVRRWRLRPGPFLRGTVSTVEGAAAGVRYLDVAAIDPAEAEELSESLGESLLELNRLRRLLTRRSHQSEILKVTDDASSATEDIDDAKYLDNDNNADRTEGHG
jgi:hypothetical protein